MKTEVLIPIFLAMLTTACGGREVVRPPEPIVITKEVKVPVGIGCVPGNYSATRPDYVDSDARLRAASDAAERYQRLWAGRAQRAAREKENEAVISGCPRRNEK